MDIGPVIGIMLIRNENDILREVLSEHVKFCDHIYVLDGTTEDPGTSKSICTSFPKVSHFTEDELPSVYPIPIRDGCRQFLIDKAREKFGEKGWFVLLHGDEIFVDRPDDIIRKYRGLFDMLTLDNVLFFVHKEQEPFKLDPLKKVQDQIRWHAGPGSPELRILRNKPGTRYDIRQHHDLAPKGMGMNYKTTYKIKHYPYRDPEQQQKRAADRTEVTNWSPSGYSHIPDRKYYLDESFFGRKFLYWISKRPLTPRISTPLVTRFLQDVAENFTRGRIR